MRYWAGARAAAGLDTEVLAGATVADVLARAEAAHAGLAAGAAGRHASCSTAARPRRPAGCPRGRRSRCCRRSPGGDGRMRPVSDALPDPAAAPPTRCRRRARRARPVPPRHAAPRGAAGRAPAGAARRGRVQRPAGPRRPGRRPVRRPRPSRSAPVSWPGAGPGCSGCPARAGRRSSSASAPCATVADRRADPRRPVPALGAGRPGRARWSWRSCTSCCGATAGPGWSSRWPRSSPRSP